MPLGTEVGFGPVGIVLDGHPAPRRKGAQQPPPLFGPLCSGTARSPISATAELFFVEATSLILLKINSPLNFKALPPREIRLAWTRTNMTGGGASAT